MSNILGDFFGFFEGNMDIAVERTRKEAEAEVKAANQKVERLTRELERLKNEADEKARTLNAAVTTLTREKIEADAKAKSQIDSLQSSSDRAYGVVDGIFDQLKEATKSLEEEMASLSRLIYYKHDTGYTSKGGKPSYCHLAAQINWIFHGMGDPKHIADIEDAIGKTGLAGIIWYSIKGGFSEKLDEAEKAVRKEIHITNGNFYFLIERAEKINKLKNGLEEHNKREERFSVLVKKAEGLVVAAKDYNSLPSCGLSLG